MAQLNSRVQLRVGAEWTSGGFSLQSAINVPLSAATLTRILTTREGGQSHIEPFYKKEDIKDCTTQYLLDRLILHRAARLTLDLEVDAEVLGAICSHSLGVAVGDTFTMLGPTDFDLPLTTMVVGFADGDDTGILFSDAATESLAITARTEQKMRVQWVLVGNALMPDAGYEFPECEDIDPLRFDQNAEVNVNGTNYIAQTRGFEFQYNNQIPLNDFPWTLGALDITRMQRGDFRTAMINWTVEGRENDTLGTAARAVPPTHYDFDILIGSNAEGVRIVAADALFEPQSTLQGFDGEVSLAVLNTMLTPTRIPGNNATPLTIMVNA